MNGDIGMVDYLKIVCSLSNHVVADDLEVISAIQLFATSVNLVSWNVHLLLLRGYQRILDSNFGCRCKNEGLLKVTCATQVPYLRNAR